MVLNDPYIVMNSPKSFKTVPIEEKIIFTISPKLSQLKKKQIILIIGLKWSQIVLNDPKLSEIIPK